MPDMVACQVSYALGVLLLKRRKTDNVKWLKYMRRMSRHTKSKDLLYEAVVLEFLVEVALMAVKNEQPIRPHLARLCILVKVL